MLVKKAHNDRLSKLLVYKLVSFVMIQEKPSSKKKFSLLAIRLVLILALWLGGTYAFEALNNLRVVPHAVATDVQADGAVNVWWPANNARVSGIQPFKAMVQDKNVSDYTMYWSVDGGQPNQMTDSSTDYPHKETTVDLSSWTWHGAGPYKVTFRALDKSGNSLGETNVDIYKPDIAQSVTTVLGATVTPAPVQSTPTITSTIVSALSPVSGVQSVSADSSVASVQVQSTPTVSNGPATVSVAAPSANAHITGLIAFKALVDGMNVSDYSMVWQVDGGNRNTMFTSNSGGTDHKEADVDLTNWKWHGAGPYKLTFTAEKNGQAIAHTDVIIYTDGSQAQIQPVQNQTVQITSVAPEVLAQSKPQSNTQDKKSTVTTDQTISTPVVSNSGNPLSSLKFFVNPNSNAKQTADAWRNSRPQDALQMDKIASSPEAIWLGGWNSNVQSDVANKINAAKSQGAVPVFIAYNVPGRDCGSFSAGGASDANSYKSWIAQIASGINGSKAIVVLEPDGLALIDCLSAQQKTDRFSMISDAVSTLKNAGAIVYIDAGHPSWISADDMSARLNSAGIAKADGFALNTSNFYTTSDNINYGTQLSGKLGGKHFVVDTARNGLGGTSDNQWCNPSGRALGNRSTANTGNSLVDAFLWLKNPGESDGNCNGGPSAGVWWPDYALGLAQRAAF